MSTAAICTIAICTMLVLMVACMTIVTIVALRMRAKNIAAAGWPPPWLDADGDAQCAQIEELAAWQVVNESKRSAP